MTGHHNVDSDVLIRQDTMTNKRLIIGIGHKARQGKDTAAEHLNELFQCRVIHFADALYEECRNATILYKDSMAELYCKTNSEDFFRFDHPNENIIYWIKEKGEQKPELPFDADYYYGGMKDKDAVLLQFWGTEFRRKQIAWDYWVDKVRSEIEKYPDEDFLIPDTRFKNEAGMIKEMGGVVWKIDRVNYVADDRDPNHASEIDLNDWKFETEFLNNGTIEELLRKVEHHFRYLKGLSDGQSE